MAIFFDIRTDFDTLRKPDAPDPDSTIPWLVEAPLSAVEIYEAILEQAARTSPLPIWTSPAGFRQTQPFLRFKMQRFDLQNRLQYTERDVSYVLLSQAESATLEAWFHDHDYRIWPTELLCTPFGMPRRPECCKPGGSHDQAVQAYREQLEELGLLTVQPLARSLLPYSVKPFSLRRMNDKWFRQDRTRWPYYFVDGPCVDRTLIPWTEVQIKASTTYLSISETNKKTYE
ncbi:hypothetical protein OCS_03167 [Ophiocordyceps sinensis CO18]|uniref:Uncharacterized protein n=1 Tax=Ophiocordyceps sinensis (strain Co18 / CGMCC 3.14243) TaxID=911162 RepID=T5AHA4_OPHSC|nr:hypothetical protein OCS_03167 [Ophiocordyceps sinensis CO18]